MNESAKTLTEYFGMKMSKPQRDHVAEAAKKTSRSDSGYIRWLIQQDMEKK